MRTRLLLLAIGLSVWLCQPTASWSRAGGGEGFSEDAGGGYSGGGGGGFTFDSDPFQNRGFSNSNRGSSIPLPVAIGGVLFLILLFWLYSKYGHRLRTGTGLGMPPFPTAGGMSQGSDWSRQAAVWLAKATTQGLPQVEAQRLQGRLSQVFSDIQNAWSQGDLEKVHRHLSDGVFSRWRIQLDMKRREGRKNLLLEPRLLRSQPLGYRRQGAYESVDLLIRASLIDLDLQQEEAVPAILPSPQAFEEIWSFTRMLQPHSSTVETKNQATEGFEYGNRCTNCGGDTSNTSGVKCQQCGAILNSGAYDWVLAEITQVNAQPSFRLGGRRDTDSQGMEGHYGLSIQEMEDRASTVFVRLVESVLDRKPGRMRPYASDACLQLLSQKPGPFPGQPLERLSVGAVEWQGWDAAEGSVRARIRVLYSTSRNTMMPTSQKNAITLVFEKKVADTVGEAVDLNSAQGKREGLNSLNCPQCGAPVGHSEQARCEYCNETLNDPQHHWVLVAIGT